MKYEGPNSYQSKDNVNVKVFADKRMDKRTGQKLYAPNLSMREHTKQIMNDVNGKQRDTKKQTDSLHMKNKVYTKSYPIAFPFGHKKKRTGLFMLPGLLIFNTNCGNAIIKL